MMTAKQDRHVIMTIQNMVHSCDQLRKAPEMLATPDSIFGVVHLGVADDAPLAAQAALNPVRPETR